MVIDHVLKLYSETIRSPYLHYGFWDNSQAVDPASLTLSDIAQAQERYIEHLASFIPDDVETILDVGCGVGGNARYLLNKGYRVEALSPDAYQEEILGKKFNGTLTFYRIKFEQFRPTKTYDLILESESACYINIREGFERARETLRDGGYLLASDYFIHFSDGTDNPHLRSSHNLKSYLSIAKETGFQLIKEYDQTESTMPTLDAAKAFVERFLEPTAEYALYSLQQKNPKLLVLLKTIFGKKIKKKMEQLSLIDSNEFRKYRRYMIFLFQKI